MHNLTGFISASRAIGWRNEGPDSRPEGICVQMPLSRRVARREALGAVAEALKNSGIEWLKPRGKVWRLDLDGLRGFSENFLSSLSWATGIVEVEPEVEVETRSLYRGVSEETVVKFPVYMQEFLMDRP